MRGGGGVDGILCYTCVDCYLLRGDVINAFACLHRFSRCDVDTEDAEWPLGCVVRVFLFVCFCFCLWYNVLVDLVIIRGDPSLCNALCCPDKGPG